MALTAVAAPAHAVQGVVPGAAAAAATVRLEIAGHPDAVPGETRERACSGALVAASWVITAASCFADASGAAVTAGAPRWATTATVGRPDLTATTGQVLKVDRLVPHPDRDVVLAHLASTVTTTTPLAVATTPPAVGETLTVAGYGRTADAVVPDTVHAAAYSVASVGDRALDIVPAQDDAAICKGDAGGPALRATASGGVELVAIHHTAYQGGCLGSVSTRREATETRVDDLRDWVGQVTAPTQHLALGGGRVGVVTDARKAIVADGLTGSWTTVHDDAAQVVLDGTRIGVLTSDGVALVKDGGITAPFVRVAGGVQQLVLSGDRIGVLTDGGDASVKEGPVNAGWVKVSGGVKQLVLSGDRIGVLTHGGDASVKEGPVNAGWVKVSGGVKQLVLSGNRIGVLSDGGEASVKEGGLGAGWVAEHGGVRDLALSGDRIGVLTNGRDALVKEGDLRAGWVVEYGGVQSMVLSGNRIGVVTGDGAALVKEGALNAGWTSVWGKCHQGPCSTSG